MLVKKPEIKIGNRKIGEMYKPLVIVEIGINHEGNMSKAKQMIYDAYKSGAECVKFQRHIIDDEMSQSAKKVIPRNANKSIWEIMERCALTKENHIELKKYVEELDMIYLCTPFSRAAADELEELDVKAYKIGSGECNNYPLVKHIASFGKPIILSTGMNNIKSIQKSIKILENSNIRYALLHCTSMYPTPYKKVRLGALNDLKKEFPNAVIGLSDHSIGNYTCFASIPYGSSILEKHFTSNKNWPGPDVSISINPEELTDLIIGSNAIYQSLGGSKEILEEEEPTIDFAYSTVVSIQHIPKGNKLTKQNIWVKRPGKGDINAEYYEEFLGKNTLKDIKKDQHIKWEDFK